MGPDLLSLREHRDSEVDLEPAELDYMLDLVKGAASDDQRVFEWIMATRQQGVYRVRPGGFVGRLGLPTGRAIDIRSRFSFPDVLTLIRLSGKLPTRADRLKVPAEATPFLVDVIAEALVREVDRLVAGGLAKGYQQHRHERPPYPGVPDINLHLGRYAGRPDKLVTRSKRLTRDIPVNRALAAALGILRRVPTGRDLSRDLASLVPAFGAVARQPVTPDQVSRLALDRLTARYRDGLALAELVLRGQTLGPKGKSAAGASVLFNMADVWEGYVAQWVRSAWDESHQVTQKHGFDVSVDGAFRGYADVVVQRDSETVALYDAKYKHLTDKPTSADIYQMATYCVRLGVNEAILVYPAPAPTQAFVVEGITIRTLGLEVYDPDEVAGEETSTAAA